MPQTTIANRRQPGLIPGWRRLLTFWLALASLVPAPVSAAGPQPTVSPALYRSLSEIHSLLAEQRYSEARAKLEPLLASYQQPDYGRALLLQTYAHLYSVRGEYRPAARYLQQALDLDRFAGDTRQRVRYNLAQLYMASEQYRQGIAVLGSWLAAADAPTADAYMLLANAHVRLEQYRQAGQPVQAANRLAKAPNESWLQLELAVLHRLQDWKGATRVLERLVAAFPGQKRYWLQLSGIHSTRKQHRQALSVLELAYHDGLLDEQQEWLRLAQLYRYLNTPYKAAKLLERGLNEGVIAPSASHWEQLADAWLQAREIKPALHALTQAADKQGTAERYLRLGQLYAEQQQWRDATQALEAAFKTGSPQQPGQAYLLLGMAYHQLDEVQAARTAWTRAADYANSRDAAQQWLAYQQRTAGTPSAG